MLNASTLSQSSSPFVSFGAISVAFLNGPLAAGEGFVGAVKGAHESADGVKAANDSVKIRQSFY
jgi:hypothetical protein